MIALVLADSNGTIGVTAFWLLLGWLASAIVAQFLSHAKGYGEKPGLASGLLLPVLAPAFWLLWPARSGARWNPEGGFVPRVRSLFPRLGRRRERDAPPG